MKHQGIEQAQVGLLEEIITDNFAGGGGASTGIEIATGKIVQIAINHDPDAIAMHEANHPYTTHLQASVWDVDPVEVCQGRPVGLAWFSPDCKHFSKAKGSALVDRKIRGLAWIVLRWAGTVRPRVIMLENVEEFVTWGPVRHGRPVKSKVGQTFRKWKSQLKNLGYVVEHRELVAADYGAPTTRKRFVLIARCDGKPIVWPERTHAPRDSEEVKRKKCKPWRSAAEIIDWSLPCYSIFESKQEIKKKYGVTAVRPLAENTLKRVIRGVDKFTIKSGRPFLVECNHSGDGHISDIHDPVNTVTARYTGGIASANLIQYHTEQQRENARVSGLDKPIQTVDASNRYGLATAQLVEYYGNGRPLDIEEPMHTATSHDREALVSAHIQKYFGGIVGTDARNPLPTVTTADHNAMCAAHIAEFKGSDIGQTAAKPLRTITTSAGEFAAVKTKIVKYEPGADLGYWPKIRELLNKHCGYDLKEDEVLLLRIRHSWYFIADIGLRMLCPRELYNAMGFPSDYIIDTDANGKPYGKTKQVARCGNAVCPPMASAVVRANMPEWCVGVDIRTMAALKKAVAV